MLSSAQSLFLVLCRENRVRALVIGGQALAARGLRRTTVDLDLLVAGLPAEADALASAWRAMEPTCDFDAIRQAASRPRKRLSYCPSGRHEIDVLTSIDGIDFAEAFRRGDQLTLDGVLCTVAAVPDLMAMKLVSQLVYERDGVGALAAREAADIALLKGLEDVR